MRKYLFALVLLCSVTSLWATSYTAVASGHFNTNATWTPTGHPTAGDTFTIPTGLTVTCDSTDGACASGTAAATTCTADGTVQVGATLKIGNGGTLTHAGELDINHGGTLNITATTASSTLVIKPGSGASCRIWFTTTGGSGASNWQMSGVSPTVKAIIKGDMSGGGSVMTMASPGSSPFPIVSLAYSQIDTCGNSSNTCFTSTFFNLSGALNIDHLLLSNDTQLAFKPPQDATTNFSINAVSVVLPAGPSGGMFTVNEGTSPTTAVRTIKNITCYVETGVAASLSNLKSFTLISRGTQCGSSLAEGDAQDASCFQGYNCAIVEADTSSDTAAIINRESTSILDAKSFGALMSVTAQNGQLWQDGIVYTRLNNPHQYAGATNVAGAQNQYMRNICDGDGVGYGDTGNFVEDNGNHIMAFNLDLNGCGEMDADQGPSTGYTELNNTTYLGYGVSLGNSGSQYSPLVIKRNLFIFPYDPDSPSQEGAFQTGLTVQAAMPRQNSLTLDYNGYYMMMGSGDTDPVMGTSTACGQQGFPCSLPNASAGTTVSYVGVPEVQSGTGNCTLVAGTNSTTAIFPGGCSTAGLQAGDYVVEQAGTRPFAQISSVVGQTVSLLAPGISGLVSGATVQVFESYWSTPGIQYGTTSGFGTHDIHANPNFVDPTRNMCSFYVRVGGGIAPCKWTGAIGGFGQLFNITSVTGTTQLTDTDAGINFVTLGIVANNDWINVYSDAFGATLRCSVLVTAVTTNSLSFTSCGGLSASDTFGFVTATKLLGRAMVTLNGWDYLGNPTSPVVWATTAQAWSWIRQGFQPQNLQYKGAGDDGSDLGAVPVLVPTTSNSHIDAEGWR